MEKAIDRQRVLLAHLLPSSLSSQPQLEASACAAGDSAGYQRTSSCEPEDSDSIVGFMLRFRHTIVLNLEGETAPSFFGFYDSHGGPADSMYCPKHLHIELRKHADFGCDPTAAIEITFLRMDEKMKGGRVARELSDYGGNECWKSCKKAIHGHFVSLCEQPVPPCGRKEDCSCQ